MVAAVLAEASIAAHIGDRFFPVGGAQGAAYPYATYQRISTQGAGHLDGASTLDWPRFQIDFWAKTALAASDAAEAFRAFFDSIERAGAGLTIEATFQDQRGPALDEQSRNFGCSQDYFVWYERN